MIDAVQDDIEMLVCMPLQRNQSPSSIRYFKHVFVHVERHSA
jgi:hypothetical protein